MPALLNIAILVFCLPVIFLPAQRILFIFWLAGIALIVGTIGCSLPYLISPNFLTTHPWIAHSPFQPQLAAFWGGICFLFGVGLVLSLICRSLLLYFRIIKVK